MKDSKEEFSNIVEDELRFSDISLYLYSFTFILGNIALPMLLHKIPMAGPRFLPIYFFVIIATLLYGWRTGIITAVFSPIGNMIITGMPKMAMVPIIMFKAVMLVFFIWLISKRFIGKFDKKGFDKEGFHVKSLNKRSDETSTLYSEFLSYAFIMLLSVLAYQFTGFIFEGLIAGFSQAFNNMMIAIPGMLIQIVAGTICLYLLKHKKSYDKSVNY